MIRLLVIDDDRDYAELLQLRLEKEGYKMEWEPGCSEAVHRLEKDMNFDVILLDVEMPERNGLATLAHLRSHFKSSKRPGGLLIPVIIATGLQSERLRDIFSVQKVADYIQKPFEIKALTKKIEGVVSKKQSS